MSAPLASWNVTRTGMRQTSEEVPDFPVVRFDAGASVYQEALVEGQYFGAGMSAMGRARTRADIWRSLSGGASFFRPLRRRQNAFEIEVDGQQLVDGWEFVDSSGEASDAVVRLRHPERGIGLEVHTALDGTPFLRRWLVIANEGERPCALSRLQPWSGMVWTIKGAKDFAADVDMHNFPDGAFSVGRMTDSAILAEGMFDWARVPLGRSVLESLSGRSGVAMPFAIVRNDATGEVLVLDFAWSGNWNLELVHDWEPHRSTVPGIFEAFNLDDTARFYASVGLAGATPLRVLEPGESATTPAVHLATLFGGLDDVTQALHRHIRTSVLPAQPTGREQRVELNHTGVTSNGLITQEKLYDEIDIAAELGFELFMLDAGWFGTPGDSWRTLGDWDESPLLPDGVRGAMDRARSKGMLAGLWLEPEVAGPGSRVLAEHPEWFMRRRDALIHNSGRGNIDLSIPEAAEHFENLVVSTIEKYALDCFRLDYNLSVGEGGTAVRGGRTESTLWRHYETLYEIFDRVRERFPDLLLENCSSGGSRADLGIMARFHWTDLTDRFSQSLALKVLNGVTIPLPPEACEGVVGAMVNGVSDVDFMIRVNMFTHFDVSGVAPALEERNAATWDRWKHGIQLYKDFCRPLLRTSRMYHHTPVQRQIDLGDWVVWENASPDRDRAYVGVFRLLDAPDDVYTLRPRGLDAGREYRVTYDSAEMQRDIDGGRLMEEGIGIRIPSALRSELLLIEAR